jgi:hypothetical protein
VLALLVTQVQPGQRETQVHKVIQVQEIRVIQVLPDLRATQAYRVILVHQVQFKVTRASRVIQALLGAKAIRAPPAIKVTQVLLAIQVRLEIREIRVSAHKVIQE